MNIVVLRSAGPVTIAVALIASLVTNAWCTPADHTESIHGLVQALHDAGEFDGSILVAEGGEVIYKKAFGIANMETGAKNTTDTVFDLASITKPFTALAVIMLAEEGKIDMKVPVRDILPGFPYERIRVEHLLTHTSGLTDHCYHPGFSFYLKKAEREVASSIDVIQWLKATKPDLEFPPGDRRRYSNTGYVVLASIVETVSGQSYRDFLHDRVFDTLDLKRTFVWTRLEDVPAARWARGHECSLDRKTRRMHDTSHGGILDGILGDAGVFSTVEDLFKVDQALYEHKLVSAEMLGKAFEGFKLNSGRKEIYGYGWCIRSKPHDPKLLWHGGKWAGFLTSFHRDIESGNTVIILSNSTTSHLTIDEFASAILNILHDRKYRSPRIPISHPVAAKLFEEGPEEAATLYRNLRKTARADYIFDEHELNLFGYQLMWEGHHDKAVAILELNAKEYPKSANVYDSLGDAYTRLAIENYRIVLDLDPSAAHTKKKLKELSALTEGYSN